MKNATFRAALLATVSTLAAGLGILSSAQIANGVVLKSQVTPASMGASGGNDCWGYVSPSGNEYALMSYRNKLSVFRITNPSNPVLIGSIPHLDSTWGDVKVYQGFCYAVCEAAGNGLQVIDLRQVDAGIVTLVKTIASPGRSHNVHIDEVSGFLYTCGSNQGTGTTMCFSLADPANPVQVGAASLTLNYQHDVQVATYTSGPLAGKQLLFGLSEGRGVDIYDVTNKNAPVLMKRVTYPSIGYCHQGWLSADRKYFYVDDELDENNGQPTTRSLIFNVEDPANATFVGTFTSNLPAIDHNQYWSDGFLFQSNYRSGLRIFDASNPTSPVQVGWYDTYPANDAAAFNGAWSNYPYFPSGNMIISDIEGGLFVVDPTEAVTRNLTHTSGGAFRGIVTEGNLASLQNSDNGSMSLKPDAREVEYPIQVEVAGAAYDNSPMKIRVVAESRSSTPRLLETVQLFDFAAQEWVVIGESTVTSADSAETHEATGNLSRFVGPNNQVKARVLYSRKNRLSGGFSVAIDQILIRVTR